MNAILVIKPYRAEGTWVFDDPAVGLFREPFVAGVPEMIDVLVREVPNAERGFRLLFSAGAFPGAQAWMERVREEGGGHWYCWRERDLEGWLCPAMFRYFDQAPQRLFVRAEPLKPGEQAEHRGETISVPREQVEQLLALLESEDVELATQYIRAALGEQP